MKKLLLSFIFCLNCIFGCFASDGALESKDDPAPDVTGVVAEPAYRVEQPPEGFVRFVAREFNEDNEAFVDISYDNLARAEAKTFLPDEFILLPKMPIQLFITGIVALRLVKNCLEDCFSHDAVELKDNVCAFIDEKRLSFNEQVDLLLAMEHVSAFLFSSIVREYIVTFVLENGIQSLLDSINRTLFPTWLGLTTEFVDSGQTPLPETLMLRLVEELDLRLNHSFERPEDLHTSCWSYGGIDFSASGKKYAFANSYGDSPSVFVYNSADNIQHCVISCEKITSNDCQSSIVWSPYYENVLAVGQVFGVKIFNSGTGECFVDFTPVIGGRLKAFCWSPCGRQITAVFDNGQSYAFNTSSGVVDHNCIFAPDIEYSNFDEYEMSYSSDGSFVAICNWQEVVIFDSRSFEPIFRHNAGTFAWSKFGNKIAIFDDNDVFVINPETLDESLLFTDVRDIRRIAWSADDRYLIILPYDNVVNVWDSSVPSVEPVFTGPRILGGPFSGTCMVNNFLFIRSFSESEDHSCTYCLDLYELKVFKFSNYSGDRLTVFPDLTGSITKRYFEGNSIRIYCRSMDHRLTIAQKVLINSIFSEQGISWYQAIKLKRIYDRLPRAVKVMVNARTKKFQLLNCCCCRRLARL
ncbi:WD40 repeat domain-containing protein [bacterium]|nr:WD40 repeat domain-containing protein [bacterium]